jgi:hypothetical protein
MLTSDQIQPKRPNPRPVLSWGQDTGRELRARQLSALTQAPLNQMLNDTQTDLRQIEDLPALGAFDHGARQIAATVITTRGRVPDDLIRISDDREMPAVMAGLSARFTA